MIKKILNPGNYPKKIDLVLLILRVVGGGFMLTHGIGKFFKLIGDDPISFADPLGVGVTTSLALTVFTEVFCAIFLIFGLATRFAALQLLITMLVAAFIVHVNDGFGKQEFALLYGVIFLSITITGVGKISLDNGIYSKIK